MPAEALEMLPHAGALDQALVALGVGLVLQARLVVEILPARLRSTEGLDVPFDLDAFVGEEAFLLGDEVVEPMPLGATRTLRMVVLSNDMLRPRSRSSSSVPR